MGLDKKILEELNKNFKRWISESRPDLIRYDLRVVEFEEPKKSMPSTISEMIDVDKKRERERKAKKETDQKISEELAAKEKKANEAARKQREKEEKEKKKKDKEV